MAKYLVSFRLRDNSTYERRYDNLMQAINDAGTGFWESGTSLIAMESAHSILALGALLVAEIDTSTDILFIREIDVKNTAYAGPVGEGFAYFFPDAREL